MQPESGKQRRAGAVAGGAKPRSSRRSVAKATEARTEATSRDLVLDAVISNPLLEIMAHRDGLIGVVVELRTRSEGGLEAAAKQVEKLLTGPTSRRS